MISLVEFECKKTAEMVFKGAFGNGHFLSFGDL
jgi:hypothetical protein